MISLAILYEEKKVIKTTTTPNYKVKDFKNPPMKEIQKDSEGKPMFRRKAIFDKEGNKKALITIAIKKGTGPRGGKTEATSIWEPKK